MSQKILAADKRASASRDRHTVAQFQGMLSADLAPMMFGFGDSRVPESDTRAAVEAVVLEYMIDLCESALDLAEDDNVTVDHLLAVVNSTGLTPKYARAQDLLASLKQIKPARTAQLADDKVENSVVKLQAAAAANAARTKQSRSRAKGGAKSRSRKKQKS